MISLRYEFKILKGLIIDNISSLLISKHFKQFSSWLIVPVFDLQSNFNNINDNVFEFKP